MTSNAMPKVKQKSSEVVGPGSRNMLQKILSKPVDYAAIAVAGAAVLAATGSAPLGLAAFLVPVGIKLAGDTISRETKLQFPKVKESNRQVLSFDYMARRGWNSFRNLAGPVAAFAGITALLGGVSAVTALTASTGAIVAGVATVYGIKALGETLHDVLINNQPIVQKGR